ncbi:MAG TPA: HAD family phosphatase [Ferruginibacter sp.]|nr:HAD family phosphatase [Ferruginibacter sp.]
MAGIKNIIFDLGGVLVDINYHLTANAFKKIGFSNFDELYSQYIATDLFENFETGKITEDDFYGEIMRIDTKGNNKEAIMGAWNAMLLGFRTASFDFLQTLKGKYNLYLLSNTNTIHLAEFNRIFTEQTGYPNINSFFTKAYYSHLVGLRKPYKEMYNYVLQDADIKPGETLFIDDSSHNIEGAALVGIKTHLLLPSERIEKLGL